jgi:hypothetical protein
MTLLAAARTAKCTVRNGACDGAGATTSTMVPTTATDKDEEAIAFATVSPHRFFLPLKHMHQRLTYFEFLKKEEGVREKKRESERERKATIPTKMISVRYDLSLLVCLFC